MALYDFICSECNDVFEIRCPISECAMPRECPKCGCGKTARYFGPDSFPTFTGDGGLTPKKVPEGFKDVLRNIKQKAIGGKSMKSSII